MSNFVYNANGDVTGLVQLTGSSIQQPVDIQNRYSQMIQTHNAVSIALSGSSADATWRDCGGNESIGFTLLNDSGTANSGLILLWSNDGANPHGAETVIANGSAVWSNARAGSTTTKGKYFKVIVQNNDAAIAHTMSAWAYLKV